MSGALSALLWHWRVLKWITRGFGFLFQKTMGLRGPPALAVAATAFMGQVEGPIFIRSYLPQLTRSELFMLMAVGMSCVSGSVGQCRTGSSRFIARIFTRAGLKMFE